MLVHFHSKGAPSAHSCTHHHTTAPHTPMAVAWFIEFSSSVCYVQQLVRCVTTFIGQLCRWPRRGKPEIHPTTRLTQCDVCTGGYMSEIWSELILAKGNSLTHFRFKFLLSKQIFYFYFFLSHLFWINFRFARFSHASLISLIKADRAIIKLSAVCVAPSHKRYYQKLWQKREKLNKSCFNNKFVFLGGILMIYLFFSWVYRLVHDVCRA